MLPDDSDPSYQSRLRTAYVNRRMLTWGAVVAIVYGAVGLMLLRRSVPASLEPELWVAMFAPAVVYAIWLFAVELPRLRHSAEPPAAGSRPGIELLERAFDRESVGVDPRLARPRIDPSHGVGFGGRLRHMTDPVPPELRPSFLQKGPPPEPGAGPRAASNDA